MPEKVDVKTEIYNATALISNLLVKTYNRDNANDMLIGPDKQGNHIANNLSAILNNLSEELGNAELDKKSGVKKFVKDWREVNKNSVSEVYNFLKSVKQYKKFLSRINPLVKDLESFRKKYDKEKEKSPINDTKVSKSNPKIMNNIRLGLGELVKYARTFDDYDFLEQKIKKINYKLYQQLPFVLNAHVEWVEYSSLIQQYLVNKWISCDQLTGIGLYIHVEKKQLKKIKSDSNLQGSIFLNEKDTDKKLYGIMLEACVKNIQQDKTQFQEKCKKTYNSLCAVAESDPKKERKIQRAKSGKTKTGLIPWYDKNKGQTNTNDILGALLDIKYYIPKKEGLFGKSRLTILKDNVDRLSEKQETLLRLIKFNP